MVRESRTVALLFQNHWLVFLGNEVLERGERVLFCELPSFQIVEGLDVLLREVVQLLLLVAVLVLLDFVVQLQLLQQHVLLLVRWGKGLDMNFLLHKLTFLLDR